ncbi:helix-hairpin-helix domain-containing protein [Arenibacter sp. 6A1]|uniref:ComEA family DNA-binding protein n=1 Tax=Arenibacter sp. 6A1 TaxID=2720391 RepID=UPI001444C1FF|nr:helix-hairpin-helix domain-containing protein [Arenibacter sp. 6A1]NKI28094.1 helix-hairpin-helix domain-containing protein [Arenibacter sp. 6A1]
MNKKLGKSHFSFNRQERSGIFFLLFIIVFIQLLYFFAKAYYVPIDKHSLQVDHEVQLQLEELKKQAALQDTIKPFPFNPNFITDYKGYALGMTPVEIDRLHRFREKGRFVNSAIEFQELTLISDSLLKEIAPFFKFPKWTQESRGKPIKKKTKVVASSYSYQDINLASPDDLRLIKGVGEVLSQRIVKFRDRLGGFITEEQLYHVYGLERQVVKKILEKYKVLSTPEVQKININSATASDIAKLVYINKVLAKEIVRYREENRLIHSFDELTKIENFPTEKIAVIQLYLALK